MAPITNSAVRWMLFVLCCAAAVQSAAAQSHQTANTLKLDKPENAPKARASDLAWLSGRWLGAGLGGTTEEVWAPPVGDQMIGMFRLVKDGKIVFSEICF